MFIDNLLEELRSYVLNEKLLKKCCYEYSQSSVRLINGCEVFNVFPQYCIKYA